VSLVIGEGQEKIVLNVDGLKKGKATVSGSKDSELLLKYEAFRVESFNRLVNPTYDAMDVAEEAGDEQGEVDAVEAYAVQNEIHRAELIDFAKKNIGTSLALYGTMLRWTGDDNITALDELVTDFEKVHPDLFMAKEMRDKVERFKKVALGVIAPDIDLIDLEGNSKKLSEVDADYILIDFWASWCGPCLLQTPDLRKAHKAFKDKGFEIYSVSIDTKDKAWKRAIEKHQLQNWTNVIDTRGWGSEVANDYNVSFVPYNFLIDRNRKIIAKNLHSKSLHNKLKKLAL
jgi:peroxiredoxin